VIKSRRMRKAGHICHMEEMRNVTEILLEGLKGREHSEDMRLNRRIILEWILGN
jgi:hypothetical protein